MKIVEVVWVDIESSGGGWLSQNKLDKFITEAKNRTVSHVGYHYEEDENQLVLVDSIVEVDYLKLLLNHWPRFLIHSFSNLPDSLN